MSDLRIVYEPYAGQDLRDVVRNGISFFNIAVTGLSEYYPVAFFVTSEEGEARGGLLGSIWGGWLCVDLLWVAQPLRGQGYGSALLAAAEKLAFERGCHSVLLDTLSFQAPAFYHKHGYQTWGVLDDCPTGHQRIYLRKSLLA